MLMYKSGIYSISSIYKAIIKRYPGYIILKTMTITSEFGDEIPIKVS